MINCRNIRAFTAIALTLLFVIPGCSEEERSSTNNMNLGSSQSIQAPVQEDTEFAVWEQEIPVHNSLPKFALQLHGGGDVFTELLIVDPSGEAVLAYKFDVDNMWGIRKDLFSVEIQDMDFDGYQDIEIFTGYGGNWRKDYIYIMWSPEESTFVGDIYGLSGLGLPTFDADTQLVHSMRRASAGDHWYYTHQYINGKLVTIEEVADNLVWDLYKDEIAKKQITALEPLYDEDFSSFVLHQKKQLDAVTGEMVVVDRKYILYHKLDDDKTMEYSPDCEIGMLLEQYEISSEP